MRRNRAPFNSPIFAPLPKYDFMRRRRPMRGGTILHGLPPELINHFRQQPSLILRRRSRRKKTTR